MVFQGRTESRFGQRSEHPSLAMSEGTTIWWVQAAALLPIPCGMSTKEEVDKDLKPSQTRCCVSQWQAICCSIGCSLAGIWRSQLDLDSVHTLPILTHYPTLVNNFPQHFTLRLPLANGSLSQVWQVLAGYNKSQESVRVLRSEKILILLPLVTSVCEIWMQNQWYMSDMVRTNSLQFKPPSFKKFFRTPPVLRHCGQRGTSQHIGSALAPTAAQELSVLVHI